MARGATESRSMRQTVENRSLLAVVVTAAVVLTLVTGVAVTTQNVVAHDDADLPGETDSEAEERDPGDGRDDDSEENRTENETRATVSGTLEQTAGEDYRLDGLVIDIGADWYTSNATAGTDLDGDGEAETIRAEFDGLVGENVTLTVETDGSEGDVFVVDGQQYRESGPPPWAGGPNGNGPPDHAGP